MGKQTRWLHLMALSSTFLAALLRWLLVVYAVGKIVPIVFVWSVAAGQSSIWTRHVTEESTKTIKIKTTKIMQMQIGPYGYHDILRPFLLLGGERSVSIVCVLM